VDHHPRRLIDNQEVGILVKDIKGNVLWACPFGSLGGLLLDPVEISSPHLIATPEADTVERDPSGFHQGLDLGA
jgi:hypothetical protein